MVVASHLMKANIGLHGFQGLWSVVLMGVIGVGMVHPGSAGGAPKFLFALCWLNIPTIVYLTMSPRFPRTRHFAHPYWIVGINTLFCIFWFAALIALSVYTNQGISRGVAEEKDQKLKDQGGCAVFSAGTSETDKSCRLYKSGVGLAVAMWLIWLTTTGIAGWAAWYYSQHMISPFEDLSGPSVDIQETTEDAFSSSEDYAPINRENPQEDYDYDDLESRTHFGHGRAVSTSSSTYTASNQAHPGRALSWAAERELYPGIGGHAPIAPVSDITMPDVRSYSSASGRL